MHCSYCDQIHASDPAYAPRAAAFDLGSEAPRCKWHWRLRCDHCGEPGHFMTRFYCPASDQLLCAASGPTTIVEGVCWAWGYWWELTCPACGERHPSLERAEQLGQHPWQRAAGADDADAARRWRSDELYLVRYPIQRFPSRPDRGVSDAEVDANWSRNADRWQAGYDEHGDETRRTSSDAVLFDFLGPVEGRRILDAGSGNGYLSRLLARRGARMVAVENARRFHELALEHQARTPLDIAYHHASIAALPFLADASFDAAVANFVLMDVADYAAAIAEIARVLRPGGRFVAVISHQSTSFRWYAPAADSPRKEDRLAWQDDDYFVRRTGWMQWGRFDPILSFHRPLRDYVAAARSSGLLLRDLEEPELTAEARRTLPARTIRQDQRAAICYVLRFERASPPA